MMSGHSSPLQHGGTAPGPGAAAGSTVGTRGCGQQQVGFGTSFMGCGSGVCGGSSAPPPGGSSYSEAEARIFAVAQGMKQQPGGAQKLGMPGGAAGAPGGSGPGSGACPSTPSGMSSPAFLGSCNGLGGKSGSTNLPGANDLDATLGDLSREFAAMRNNPGGGIDRSSKRATFNEHSMDSITSRSSRVSAEGSAGSKDHVLSSPGLGSTGLGATGLGVSREAKGVAETSSGGCQGADQEREDISWLKKQIKPKRIATSFVSTPAAFSSETRDARLHQGKFDMCSVLQMQMAQDRPCLVCDISGGQVMTANQECEELFGCNEDLGGLVERDIFSLFSEDDREKLSSCLAYVLVSARPRMEPQQLQIVTLLGERRTVLTDGAQLMGSWWKLELNRISDS